MPTWGDLLVELQQRMPAEGPGVFDTMRRHYLRALHAKSKRAVILYATRWTDGNADPGLTSITPDDVHGLMEVVHGLKGDELDLVLHSPGGSPEATEAIVDYLRSKFKSIRVLIPHAAMSAATMLSCAANQLVMGRHSSIGPVDPQFILQTELGRRAVPAQTIIDQFRLAQVECAANPSAIASWLPILRSYAPGLLVQAENALALAELLVRDWLRRFMFAGEKNAAVRARKVARFLADHGTLKSHGRHISATTARKIGLKVEDLEADQQLQDTVLSIYHMCKHLFASTPCVKVIENHLGKCFMLQTNVPMMVPQGARKVPVLIPATGPPVPVHVPVPGKP